MRRNRFAWLSVTALGATLFSVFVPGLCRDGWAAAAPAGNGNAAVRVPPFFVENRGQTDPAVKYYARLGHGSVYATRSGIVFDLTRPLDKALRERLVLSLGIDGARSDATIAGTDPRPGAVNVLKGQDRAGWRRNIPMFGGVGYSDIYDNIDTRLFWKDAGRLEYEFVVRPGGDPGAVRMVYRGADGLAVTETGELRVATAFGDFRESRPYVYQDIEGRRVERRGAFRLLGQDGKGGLAYGFEVEAYDHSRSLVIDPGLYYSTYLGGGDNDTGWGIAIDGDGSAYVAGQTHSDDFPHTTGAYKESLSGDSDAFIVKFNAAGTSLEYATYLGGAGLEDAAGIAVNGSGNAYVTGSTDSDDFPVTLDVYQDRLFGQTDAFVTELNAAGNGLVYSTYLGGGGMDEGKGIALDTSGNAHITGRTTSSNFPKLNYWQGAFAGVIDAFVTKLDWDATSLVFSTYLGGSGSDEGWGIAVAGEEAYVTGGTASSNFPRQSAYQNAFGGVADAFVAHFDADGGTPYWSTFLGGANSDSGLGIAVDGTGQAHITGTTESANFPTESALQAELAGASRPGSAGARPAVPTPANSPLSQLSSRVSPPLPQRGDRGDFDTADLIESTLASPDLIGKDEPLAPSPGNFDVFVTKFAADGQSLSWSTFLGGSATDRGYGIGLDADGGITLVGVTWSTDFPLENPWQAECGGCPTVNDAFISRLDSTGQSLIFSSYLGGVDSDAAYFLALNSSKDVYLTGTTTSTDFPVRNAFQEDNAGEFDAFVTKYEGTGPMLVDLSSFTARRAGDSVLVEWATASEVDLAGFHVWRGLSASGDYVRITPALIPGKGGPSSGAEYSYEDADVEPGATYSYKLEDIDDTGASTLHGPVSVNMEERADWGVAKSATVPGDGTSAVMNVLACLVAAGMAIGTLRRVR